jgi:hypothetical protein
MDLIPPGMTRRQFWQTIALMFIPGFITVALIELGLTINIG